MNHLDNDSQHSNDDKFVPLTWTVPGTTTDESCTSSSSSSSSSSTNRITRQLQQRVQRCVDLAISCANDFNQNFQTYCDERENLVPQFHPDEIDIEATALTTTPTVTNTKEAIIPPVRVAGFYKEYILRSIQLLPETKDDVNDPSKPYYKAKKNFTKRSMSEYQYYSVKRLQDGIMETDHGPYAATEMIVETKILMNLSSPHPHILRIHGITSSNVASLSFSRKLNGQDSYFFITDRISETLTERMEQWRQFNNKQLIFPSTTNVAAATSSSVYHNPTTVDEQKLPPHITKRLEIALDVASALIFLHDRDIVYYLRPDKIGFDMRYGVVKLCYFGQCRQNNMESNPRSVTQSDNMSVLAYTAPEVLCMAPAHTVADVYGFGILLWETISLQRPYHGYDRSQHFENVVRNHDRPLDMNTEDNTWDKDIVKLIKRCIRPYQRPTMKTIHNAIETKLLYYEPGGDNDILDTAQIIQRRHSAGLLEQFMSEIKHQTDPIVAVAGTAARATNSKRRKSSLKKRIDAESKSENERLPTTTRDGDERCQSSYNMLNSSALSLLSGCNLDEMLQEVSDQLSGETIDGYPNSNNLETSCNSIGNKELSENALQRSRERHSSRKSTINTRRSRCRSGQKKPITKSDENHVQTDINKSRDNVRRGRDRDNLEKGEFDNIGDDEDLIASIMSQSDEKLVHDPQAIDPGALTQYPYKVTEVRKSILGNRSPIRLRQRSRSRSTSRSRAGSRSYKQPSQMLPADDTDESVADSELPVAPSPPNLRPKLKLSPAQAVENVSRKARYSSNPRSSRDDQVSHKNRPALSRADSDSTLGIRRKRRTSVTEVKEKFDFVPDSPQKTNSNKNLKGLQNVLERVSPIRVSSKQFKKEKYPISPPPTNHVVQTGMKLWNGVLRRGSSKEAATTTDVETTPIRRQMRRGSGSLVKNLVLQSSSSRILEIKNSHVEGTSDQTI